MKALILAAGYGTRLYPLTKNKAKPLLPVGGKVIIDYLVEQLDAIAEIDHIYVVTNAKFAADFERWAAQAAGRAPITAVSDGTTSDADKLGAIGDMHFVITRYRIAEPLLIVGGDNIFTFDLREFVRFYHAHGSSVGLYKLDDLAAITRYNETVLDTRGRIVSFREKPPDPKSTLFAVCLYLYAPDDVRRVAQYLEDGNNPDAPGHYVAWLHTRAAVYGFPFPGTWYDIGDLNAYNEADRFFAERAGTE
jgi:glucose-1-phosphate thymidylyltransferase